ncbi:MAG TPA: VWA domain-containing protein [Thermoanaerobaculia bacterium]|nr:VWA domain-containing protein [Thermoanaerobaculia bacterium]
MSFRFATMLWLLALVPFVLAFLVMRQRTRERIARRFAIWSDGLSAPRSVPRRAKSPSRQMVRPLLLAAAIALAILALAGPHAGFTLVPIIAREANRVVVIDVSNSMAAEDVGTSRLSAAKALAIRLANAQEGRIALVIFEAEPEVVSPLTTDTDAVAALIDTIAPGETGQPGSDAGSAILAALRLIEADASQKADMVVISDGEDQGLRVAEAVQRAKTRGVEVSTIVVGSSSGSTIPTGRGPLRDEAGDVVTTYASTRVMNDIARGTGGTLLENPFGARALDPLLRNARAATNRQTEARVPIDRYQWPLALAFAALLSGSLLHRGAE